jgi:hypothetical protein
MVANTAGQTKKSSVMSHYNCGSAVGNIVGPLLFSAKYKPHYIPGSRATLDVFCALMVVIQCLVLSSLLTRSGRSSVSPTASQSTSSIPR